MSKRHPIQPLETDEHGVVRFKRNAIVEFLLDNGTHDMNTLWRHGFSREDHEQFAQLIGYSLSGAGDLDYVSTEVYDAATLMHERGLSESDARIAALEERLENVRAGLRDAAVAAFRIHPDDLEA